MSEILLPLGILTLAWRGDGPSPLGQVQKRAHQPPIPTMSVALKEDEPISQGEPLPSGSPEAKADPLGSSILPMGLQKGLSVPCHFPELALTAKAFSCVNLKGSGKMNLCGECTKSTFNQDSMVTHFLQEHLGVIYSASIVEQTIQTPQRSLSMTESVITCCFI